VREPLGSEMEATTMHEAAGGDPLVRDHLARHRRASGNAMEWGRLAVRNLFYINDL